MKAPVYSLEGKQKGEVALGRAFSMPVRADIIRRAFLAESSLRQPYGADPLAGKRTSAHYHGLRHYRYTMMNREMARMPRIHSQGYLNYTARFVPQSAKGRKAHPPKAGKVWKLKINKKERMLALLSAISATARKEYLRAAGHSLPLVVEDRLQEARKAKDVLAFLKAVGVQVEPLRKVRAGRGKSRGRRYRIRRGPLIITDKRAFRGPAGVEVVLLKDLRVSDLAPGGHPGRLCIWTESSVRQLDALGGGG